MKRLFLFFAVVMFSVYLAGCTFTVNLTNQPENPQYAETEVITGIETEEKTNYVQKLELTKQEEFYLNAFATGNRQNAVFEIITEDYSEFELKVYKFEDGEWKYTNNVDLGKIKDKKTYLAVEYCFLPKINFAFLSGSYGGNSYDAVYDVEFNYMADTTVREWFEVTEEETAFIAYRRFKDGEDGKLANTTDFANPKAVTDADGTDEYYMITIKFNK